MNKKLLILGAIILVAGILMSIAGSIMYESDKEHYNYWYEYYIDYPDETAFSNVTEMYESNMNFDSAFAGLGILLVIISFPMMIIGVFIKEKKDNKQPEQKRHCPQCGRPLQMDFDICPYCGKDFRIQK